MPLDHQPSVASAKQLDDRVLVTFAEAFQVDATLLTPAEYTITGPTEVLVQTARTVSDRQVLLSTIGLGTGTYTLRAGSIEVTFTGSVPRALRSVFTERGPIAKPVLTLQSGNSAIIVSPTQVRLPGAQILPEHIGLYVALESPSNEGAYRILSRVSGAEVKLAASLSLSDPMNEAIAWRLIDYRDGQIADDPSDVVVRINEVETEVEAVIGLLGQVVLSTVPAPTDDVKIDYAWISNPVVDFRRLNSREFRLNHVLRDDTEQSAHKYRYSTTLVQPVGFEALDLRAQMAQPQQRDLKYRAYERAYSVALNDPSLLLLNSPNHRIAFPPMSRALSSTFVSYQGTVLPEAAPDPWDRAGSGSATVSGADLSVVDEGDEPIFWTRTLDLTFDHVFALAWRVRIDAVPVQQGVFTGVVAGYSDGLRACVVGYLNDGGTRKLGILRKGFGNDPSTSAAWTGGLSYVETAGEQSESATGEPTELDWSTLRSYRIFRGLAGAMEVFVDGAIVPSLRVSPDDLPSLHELNAPFRTLQGPFFGSLSREAESTSVWSFVRYTALPLNPFQSQPSIFVTYEGDAIPEAASQPWTPVGFHGTETIIDGSHLLLDSTSATALPSFDSSGLISGDFKGYARIEPLLKESFDTHLEVRLAVRTHTQGIAPNAVMAAIDDGNRLMQLCFFSDQSAPKLSYGGRTLPPDFEPYPWSASGTQPASMVGQYLRIEDSGDADGLIYSITDDGSVFGSDFILEFRVCVLSYEPREGFCGVMAIAHDGARAVGLQLAEYGGTRCLELFSDDVALSGDPRFDFDWYDGAFHTFRLRKSTVGDQVAVFADGQILGVYPYSHFKPVSTGRFSFGSSTALNHEARSHVLWAYANCWCVSEGRKFAGLWKGYDPDALTGYHLPISASGRAAAVAGNALVDSLADFVSSGTMPGDQLIVDEGPNKGVYTVESVTATKVTLSRQFVSQPSRVAYRCVKEVDWSAEHRYRIVKDASGVAVYLDGQATPLIRAAYSHLTLPASDVGIPHAISGGLPSVTWGAFDPTNLSQTAWDFVRFGAIRSLSAQGIVPHHQVLNQQNVIASYEHRRSNIPHSHTNFWSNSEGIPPQLAPDLLRDPNLVAFTLLNDSTPLVPATQAYEINTSDDALYNSLQVIERATGELELLASLDDDLVGAETQTFHQDVYEVPPQPLPSQVLMTHGLRVTPTPIVTRLNSTDVLGPALERGSLRVGLRLSESMPATSDGPATAILTELWPLERVALLNNRAFQLNGAQSALPFITAENTTPFPLPSPVIIAL